MAEDLWETALNTKPKWLAGLNGDDRLAGTETTR